MCRCGATARAGSAVPAPAADTVMLSEATDGDYIVRRFLVKRQGDTDYSIRYQINLASLSAALDGNSRELDGLNAFVDNLMRDTLMNVKSVEITGYSSPDGPGRSTRPSLGTVPGISRVTLTRSMVFRRSTTSR